MTDSEIAVNGMPFWVVTALAIALLTLVKSPWARQVIFACLNIGYVLILLGVNGLPFIAVLIAAFSILRAMRDNRLKTSASLLFVAGVFGLFLFHKSAFVRVQIGHEITTQVLTAVGFSYVFLRAIEVWRLVREGIHEPPTFISLVNYLLPFNMLTAGPIQSYDDFVRQPPGPPELTKRDVLEGVELIAWGLFKKFVLAYFLQKTFLTDLQSEGLYFFFEMQVMLIWLYLDFSAYSDIAVGIGRLMGMSTPENFNRPFVARNLIEFWDRWHISLSLWVRRNLFIPLQLTLMRHPNAPSPLAAATAAIGISFVLVGLWHGLTLGWLVWGILHAFGLMGVRIYGAVLQSRFSPEKIATYRDNTVLRWIGIGVTFEYVAFAFVPIFLLKGTF
jgi:D-alanyl-lipoteichoic acid acyltransferase DltB (MBOAT superfamily)